MKLTKLTREPHLNVITATFRTFWGNTKEKTIYCSQVFKLAPFWMDTGEMIAYPLSGVLRAFVDMDIDELIIK